MSWTYFVLVCLSVSGQNRLGMQRPLSLKVSPIIKWNANCVLSLTVSEAQTAMRVYDNTERRLC